MLNRLQVLASPNLTAVRLWTSNMLLFPQITLLVFYQGSLEISHHGMNRRWLHLYELLLNVAVCGPRDEVAVSAQLCHTGPSSDTRGVFVSLDLGPAQIRQSTSGAVEQLYTVACCRRNQHSFTLQIYLAQPTLGFLIQRWDNKNLFPFPTAA